MDDFLQRARERFHDPALFDQALTHRSYANERGPRTPDNERLEFLGDALLTFLVAEYLYLNHPRRPEGELTRLRAALVRDASLARWARELGFPDHLRVGQGAEMEGARERPSVLADAMEAFLGALYLDQGIEIARAFVFSWLEREVPRVLAEGAHLDPKSQLQELIQGAWGVTPRYRIVEERGPEHARTFVAEVWAGERVLGRGEGRSKQEAQRAAAREALQRLAEGKEGTPTPSPRGGKDGGGTEDPLRRRS